MLFFADDTLLLCLLRCGMLCTLIKYIYLTLSFVSLMQIYSAEIIRLQLIIDTTTHNNNRKRHIMLKLFSSSNNEDEPIDTFDDNNNDDSFRTCDDDDDQQAVAAAAAPVIGNKNTNRRLTDQTEDTSRVGNLSKSVTFASHGIIDEGSSITPPDDDDNYHIDDNYLSRFSDEKEEKNNLLDESDRSIEEKDGDNELPLDSFSSKFDYVCLCFLFG